MASYCCTRCCTKIRNGQFLDGKRPLTWVELRGFEPLTPSMRTRCATGLRYSPKTGSQRSKQSAAGWPVGLLRRAANPAAVLRQSPIARTAASAYWS
jgi:hypothetical protein